MWSFCKIKVDVNVKSNKSVRWLDVGSVSENLYCNMCGLILSLSCLLNNIVAHMENFIRKKCVLKYYVMLCLAKYFSDLATFLRLIWVGNTASTRGNCIMVSDQIQLSVCNHALSFILGTGLLIYLAQSGYQHDVCLHALRLYSVVIIVVEILCRVLPGVATASGSTPDGSLGGFTKGKSKKSSKVSTFG